MAKTTRFALPFAIVVTALGWTLPTSAGAQAPRTVEGVRADATSQSRLALSIRDGSPALIRGARGRLACQTVEPTDGPAISRQTGVGGSRGRFVVPRRGRVVRARGTGIGDADVCRVSIVGKRRRFAAVVPITQRGADYVDEGRAGARLAFALAVAGDIARRRPDRLVPPTAELVRAMQSVADKTGAAIDPVPLSSLDATPTVGSTGVYSDGTTVSAVLLSATGRRLFLTSDGQSQTTNLQSLFFFSIGL